MNKLKSEKISTKSVSIGQSLSGKYKLFIIDKNDEIIYEQDWKKNLILNQGMDAVSNNAYTDLMKYGAVGIGTRDNSIPSGDSTGSMVNSIITLLSGSTGLQSFTSSVGGYVSALSTGDVIKFNDSTEAMVLGVSYLSASVTSSSTTVTSQSFTIWKTSQVGLQNEIHRTNNMFAGTGYCGTTIVGTLAQTRRTWDFSYETSSVNFSEVGVGWASIGNNTIFSRVLLPTPVFIDINQKIRLIYELDINTSPTAGVGGIPATASISGWPISPSTDTGIYYNLGALYNGSSVYTISAINTSGNNIYANIVNLAIDPAGQCYAFINNYSGSVAAAGVYVPTAGSVNDTTPVSLGSYSPLSFNIIKTAIFPVASFARNDIRCIGLGPYISTIGSGTPYTYPAFYMVFNQPQTKTNVQTLTLSWIYTWGRTLA